MSTHRFPKGSYVRNTLDFHSDRIGLIAYTASFSTSVDYAYFHYYLLNNSNVADSIFVWWYQQDYVGAGVQACKFTSGTSGALVANGQSNFSDGGTPPGVLYLDQGPTTHGGLQPLDPLFTLAGQQALVQMGTPGAINAPIFDAGPIVLKPGAVLLFFSDYQPSAAVISIVYTFMPGGN